MKTSFVAAFLVLAYHTFVAAAEQVRTGRALDESALALEWAVFLKGGNGCMSEEDKICFAGTFMDTVNGLYDDVQLESFDFLTDLCPDEGRKLSGRALQNGLSWGNLYITTGHCNGPCDPFPLKPDRRSRKLTVVETPELEDAVLEALVSECSGFFTAGMELELVYLEV